MSKTKRELEKLEEEIMQDIFYTAVEEGIDYWCTVIWETYDSKECIAYIWEDDEGKDHRIDLDTIKLGMLELVNLYLQAEGKGWGHTQEGSDVHRLAAKCNRYAIEPFAPHGIYFVDKRIVEDGEGIDTYAADIIVQHALFGDLVYG